MGTSYGPQFTFTTLWDCGSTITINHVAGALAPVSKTVTYGSVTNIPGETSKCWITSNLGADHQAAAVSDATEASAGWYWQFNRQQGYKIADDGTTRTPNSAWITLINENMDWQAANDPCSIELGSNWRIPTLTEWTNVDAAGGWTTWTGPWSSGLKLHASGVLWNGDGTLANRGIEGDFWSSTQSLTDAGNDFWISSGVSQIDGNFMKAFATAIRCLRAITLPTVTTIDLTNIFSTTAASGGNVMSDGGMTVTARGVCWGIAPGPTTAGTHTSNGTGLGSFSSSLTGLTSGKIYYVRAYATNSAGTSYGNELSFTTQWDCSSSLTVNHVAGAVAPVSKTVTYGSVTNIPGEPSKCWITSNLGADHQATAVSDATEASAGWYWQFNRQQGYKIADDGTTRTPNSAWISSIIENFDWQAANDPCSIELGSNWHIPTYTEWNNVKNGWTNWASPWSSGLKMHAAGALSYSNGSLISRGSEGDYWSSTQNPNASAYDLYFDNVTCQIDPFWAKAWAASIRCLRALALPIVTTTAVTTIGTITATSGGVITSDGNAIVSARGVCWGTSPGPTTAGSHTSDGGGLGSFVSSLTGLSGGTLYYIRAYATNSVGTSYGNEFSFIPLWYCGSAITVNHVAGAVAPVSKTVTYGSVTNIPGELSKCWITSNLGADHQASTVSDATEASAGWYWQFNCKQGYKMADDGVTRTPNTAWITYIDENMDWQPANDPCTIELGGSWRIPTSTEWNNVKAGGSWTTWTGPWSSGLKMHAAGYIRGYTGLLIARSTEGDFWSSNQNLTPYASGLYFNVATCQMDDFFLKADATSIRCLRAINSPTVTTTSVTNLTLTTATGGGNVLSDGGALVTARGVCWSRNPGPTIAGSHTTDGSGTGSFTSSLSGMIGGCLYYVRAYATNSMGTSCGPELSFTTLWTCGSSLTINHVAGTLAPVSKTVTYGSVTNIPGETSKCWITSNLGATHQATAVNDATEASGGWYWQFNLMQGYKLADDGTTRTPGSVWISSIFQDSDWQSANDPCSIELGSNWHVPTSSEWNNVNAAGGWTTWTGPWNSGLKLHAAGTLWNNTGLLTSRGTEGDYWSSTQNNAIYSTDFWFDGSNSTLDGGFNKAYATSIRCIRN